MNKEYFENSEKTCDEKFIDFNNKTGIFHDLERIDKQHMDFTASTYNKFGEITKWNVELKNRNVILQDDGTISGCTPNGRGYTGETLFIENHKITDLLLDRINGYEAVYINFTINGYIIVYNLNKLTKRPEKTIKNNIYSKGYEKKEDGRRQGLYLIDATIFNNEGKMIKRSGEDFI